MAKENGKNRNAKRPIANMNMMGGNHQGRDAKSIIAENRKSYLNTVDNKLGTNHSQANAAHTSKVKHITPGEIGKNKPGTPSPSPAKPNSWVQKVRAGKAQEQAASKPAPAKQQTVSKTPAKAPNKWAQQVQQAKATPQQTKPPAKTPQRSKPITKGR